jgi:hypothetical protein
MPTPQQWWIQTGISVEGPFTGRQLKEIVDDGQISPTTQVRLNADGAWVAAGSVPGLFDAPPLPPSPAALQAAAIEQGELESAWRVVHTFAVVWMVLAAIFLLIMLRAVGSSVTGIRIAERPPEPLSETLYIALFSAPIPLLILAGGWAALRRRRWGLVLVTAATFIGCGGLMWFIVSDSFKRVWKSFAASRQSSRRLLEGDY